MYTQADPRDYGGGQFNLYGYAEANPLNETDQTGLATFQIGGSFNFDLPFGVGGTGGAAIAVDQNGDVDLLYTGGGGVGEGASFSGGLSIQASDATSVSDLGGPFVNTSASGGAVFGGSADVFSGTGKHGDLISGGGLTLGVGFGAGASAALTGTGFKPLGNINGFFPGFKLGDEVVGPACGT